MKTAGEEFAKAIEMAPDYGEAWENRAVVAIYFHQWDQAIEYEQRALANLARLDSSELARANLGWAYYGKQDLVHAQTELLQANQGPRYFCLGQYRLASVYFARNDFEQTAAALKPTLTDDKLCPPMQEARYLGGEALARLHDHEAAARAFNECVAMAPRSCQARECKKALAEVGP
jgi:tetratricopeptide (TPR) repeat protein